MSWTHIQGHDRWIQGRSQTSSGKTGWARRTCFSGRRGVGKRLFAAELAKTLLCENRRRGVCRVRPVSEPVCSMDAGTHPDFFAVERPEGKNELPVEVIRGLCRDFSLKPARGHGKMAILDDADDLNDESANCFLKTLEEPPPRSVIFLIGTSRDQQLPTILSRCQVDSLRAAAGKHRAGIAAPAGGGSRTVAAADEVGRWQSGTGPGPGRSVPCGNFAKGSDGPVRAAGTT